MHPSPFRKPNSVAKLTPVAAGKAAFKEFLQGADRSALIERLHAQFGIEAVFQFGQSEYYHRRKKAA